MFLALYVETFWRLLVSPFTQGVMLFVYKFVPFVLFFEVPVYAVVFLGIFRHVLRQYRELPSARAYQPVISCLVLGYREGEAIQTAIRSLMEQVYPGLVEIIVIIDGARQNAATFDAAKRMEPEVAGMPRRRLVVVPKWQRGGRVSSLNAGLSLARGEILMVFDGDTSFDNCMIAEGTKHFQDPNVVGVAGSLRVRNVTASLWTRLQAIEYLLSIHATKVGLSELNTVNNISGAFGIFRRSFIQDIGGWDSGTAEDLDLTLRIKNYFGRHPNLRIAFEPNAVGHTDVPVSLKAFLIQRLRWDGDLFYLYIRKHRLSFQPAILGWRNFIMILWTGLFFQLALPFVILVYSIWTLLMLPPGYVLGVWSVVYLFYLLVTLMFYSVFMLFVSDRPAQDLRLLLWLPLFPLFTFITRIWGGIATLWEMAFKAHLDSSMAPYYVLRRTKF